MRERARTVIVGGGPAGNALAMALAAGGDTDVLVLDPRAERADRDVPTARFGAVLQAAHAIADVRLARDAIGVFADLARDDDVVWQAVGSLEVATSEERLTAVRRRAALLADAGVDAEVLDPRGAAALLPAIDAGTILGALHVPTDGVADRAAVGAALARRTSAAGVTGAVGIRVTGIRSVDGRIAGVETDAGAIACERLVLASCTESVRVASLAGIVLPVVSVPRPIRLSGSVAPTDGVGAAMPVVRHSDASLAVRRRGDVLALAGHGDPASWASAAARLLPSCADALRDLSASPAEEAVVTATPDGAPIVGPHAGLPGLWVLVGARLAHLPALADALAARLLDARVQGDRGRSVFAASDPNRWYPFEAAPAVATPRATMLVAAAHDLVPPVADELPPRGLRLSPIARRAEGLGASYGAIAGWEVPRWYARNGGDRDAAVAAEIRAAREAVALADRTPLAKFDVAGEDAAAVLGRLFPELDELAPGVLHPATPPERSPVSDIREVVVVRKDATLVRIVAPARDGQRVLAWLRTEIPTGDLPPHRARITERTGSLFALAILGPRAEEVLAAVADAATDDRAFPVGTARYLGLGPVTPVWAHRDLPAGPDAVPSWTLFGQSAMGEFAWDLLMRAGGGPGIVPAGAVALGEVLGVRA